MERRKPARTHSQWRVPEPWRTHIKLAAMVATAAAPLFVLTSLVPRPLVLPVVCLVAIAGAAVMAFVAWQRGSVRDARNITAWDIAGAFAFIACAAAIMSNPEHLVHLTEGFDTISEHSTGLRSAMLNRH